MSCKIGEKKGLDGKPKPLAPPAPGPSRPERTARSQRPLPPGLRPQGGEPRGPRPGRQPTKDPRGEARAHPGGPPRARGTGRGAGGAPATPGRGAGDNKACAAAAPSRSPPIPRCCGARKAPHFGEAERPAADAASRRRHPRSAPRRTSGVNLRDDPVSTGAFAGPAPAGRARSPAANPLPSPPRGPRASAPQSPYPEPGAAPLAAGRRAPLPARSLQRRPTSGFSPPPPPPSASAPPTTSLRAPPPSPGLPSARPGAGHCACARAPLCAVSVSPPRPGESSSAHAL